ncbi:uncharacterized protein [Periplaneta americana]|uniref:uncharacterized protein n=1 Tax=Periplaneta americana TaxID=6978 RepID=UPI0037E7666C
MKQSSIWVLLCVNILLTVVYSKPTIYKKNENDKLEPVLVPVSSTVIPLPVYKIAFGVGVGSAGKKPTKPEEAAKLITATKKKSSSKEEEEENINIKQISKDEYEKRT